jgi:hypothetical protein
MVFGKRLAKMLPFVLSGLRFNVLDASLDLEMKI